LAAHAFECIGALYGHEAKLRTQVLSPAEQLAYRGEFAKPIVDTFFAWLARTLREQVLLPSNPFTQAAPYALEREAALRVFLE